MRGWLGCSAPRARTSRAEGLISRNVAALSAAPRVRVPEGRTLTIEQARHLLDAVSGDALGLAVLLALTCGMRRGEVLGLHWSALDWRRGTLKITHGVKRVKNRDRVSTQRTRLVIAELKTPNLGGLQRVPPEVVARLRQHHVRQAEARIAAGSLWRDHGLIFTTTLGMPSRRTSRTTSRSSARPPGLVTGIPTSYVTREPR